MCIVYQPRNIIWSISHYFSSTPIIAINCSVATKGVWWRLSVHSRPQKHCAATSYLLTRLGLSPHASSAAATAVVVPAKSRLVAPRWTQRRDIEMKGTIAAGSIKAGAIRWTRGTVEIRVRGHNRATGIVAEGVRGQGIQEARNESTVSFTGKEVCMYAAPTVHDEDALSTRVGRNILII